MLEDASPSVVALLIDEGAHHGDLMFSQEGDPASIVRAREVELQHMRAWVRGATRGATRHPAVN